MEIGGLIRKFLDELSTFMEGWRPVKGDRSFRRTQDDIRSSFHITCVKHLQDFDAVGDVAVEILTGRERVCIVGAELGNIAGTGQRRFPVSSSAEAKTSATLIYSLFEEVGMPFIERFSEPQAILETLKSGGREAMLISPIVSQPARQVEALDRYVGV